MLIICLWIYTGKINSFYVEWLKAACLVRKITVSIAEVNSARRCYITSPLQNSPSDYVIIQGGEKSVTGYRGVTDDFPAKAAHRWFSRNWTNLAISICEKSIE